MLLIRLLTYCILILMLGSCTPAVQLLFGIRQPKEKTEKQIVKSINKYHFDGLNNYAITYKGFMRHFALVNSVNDIKVYSSNGNLIEFTDSSRCSGRKVNYINKFQDTTLTKIVDSISLDSLYSELRTIKGDMFTTEESGKYTVVFYWATYAGRLNKDLNQEWVELSEQLDTSMVDFINVSLDIRDFWSVKSLKFKIE